MTNVMAGHSVPAFSLTSAEGQQHSLRDALQRGPAVIAFFKVSCPVCQFTFPYLERLYQGYKSEKLTFWGISQDDGRDTKEFHAEYGVTFPSLIDQDNYRVSNQFGLTTVPTVLFIGQDGRVQVSFTGFDKKELEKMSTQLAKQFGKAPATLFRPDEIVPDYKPG